MQESEGLVSDHMLGVQPAQALSHVGYMIEFSPPRDDTGGKVDDFLHNLQVLCGAIAKDCDAIPDVGEN